MSRCYTVIFNTPKGYVEVLGYGNVRRTAEISARHRLRDMGFNLNECSRHSITPKRKEKDNV